MNFKTSTTQRMMLLVGAGLTILAFQNCSKASFSEKTDTAMFRLAGSDLSSPADGVDLNTSTDSSTNDDKKRSPNNDQASNAPEGNDNDQASNAPEGNDNDHVSNAPEGNDNDHARNAPEGNDNDHARNAPERNNNASRASLVECQLIAPNQKIILDTVMKKGSNASATRTCMSEYACLRLINAYSAKRGCELSLGASELADSEAQCTKIFPGSKGTCRNARVVTDDEVADILAVMGK